MFRAHFTDSLREATTNDYSSTMALAFVAALHRAVPANRAMMISYPFVLDRLLVSSFYLIVVGHENDAPTVSPSLLVTLGLLDKAERGSTIASAFFDTDGEFFFVMIITSLTNTTGDEKMNQMISTIGGNLKMSKDAQFSQEGGSVVPWNLL